MEENYIEDYDIEAELEYYLNNSSGKLISSLKILSFYTYLTLYHTLYISYK